MGVVGLPDFRGNKGFWRAYPPLIDSFEDGNPQIRRQCSTCLGFLWAST